MPFLTYKQIRVGHQGFFLRYSGLCDRQEILKIQDLLYTLSEVAIVLSLSLEINFVTCFT